LLGGLVGGLAAAALVVGATALGASAATVAGLVLFGEFAAIGTSIVGAVMGWNKAAREQRELAVDSNRPVERTQAPAQSQELTPQVHRSFADKLTPRLRDGSYAEAIAAEKTEASPAQAAR
jgi:hypothetical protein